MRRFAAILAALALVVVLVVGLTQAGSGSDSSPKRKFDLGQAERTLQGAPAPLASLHRQSSQLLPGGPQAFQKRLASLKGYPVVVNKWASWCVPCRSEFPLFQSQAVAKGKQVAFLGVNAGDSTDPAHRFLRAEPLPYPSYLDHDEKIAKSIRAPANYPITVFFDRRGKLAYVHQGAYRNQSDLADDMRRYLS
jgi:cytochrome c biogenesis protein CcmG, thiol:disulfide interchange protein DsbE